MNEARACIFNIQRFSIHDGPGIRTTVFFKGCPLRCAWCANPESQKRLPEPIWDNIKKRSVITGDYLTVDEVMAPILKDIDYYQDSGGGVTLSGGEVLFQKDFAIELLKQCRHHQIATACETSAYASPKDFKALLDQLDLLIMDVKHYDSKQHRLRTGAALEPILKNLDYAVAMNKPMLVRIPIIPDFNNSIDDAHHFGRLLQAHHVQSVEILPFHQFGKNKYKFLKRNYEFENYQALTKQQLEPIAAVIRSYGVQCAIN